MSKQHAEIYLDEGGTLRVRDLASTNGTFVNRARVDDAPLRAGDVVHFAEFEFRVGAQSTEVPTPMGEEAATVALEGQDLPQRFEPGSEELRRLLRTRAVFTMFQPVYTLPGRVVAGFEALGRGRHPGLPEAPGPLLRIASSIGYECELSRLFREVAIEAIAHRTDFPPLFLNTHPSELGQPGLIESLAELQKRAPRVKIYLEIHEGALADPAQLATLRGELSELDIGLAYDDFGAGQARLLELAEVPPDYLKFDRRFIHGIDRAPVSRRRILSSLVSASRDLLVQTVAEGVETEAEARVCSEIGFSHAQGFYLSMPLPADQL